LKIIIHYNNKISKSANKSNCIIVLAYEGCTMDERAPPGQRAHSPGLSATVQRESNIDNPHALQEQKH